MTHFGVLSSHTYGFLLQLKHSNELWYHTLVNASKKNPGLCHEVVDQIYEHLKFLPWSETKPNIFEICKASNQGLLEQPSFGAQLKTGQWEVYLQLTINQLKAKEAKTVTEEIQ